MASSETPGGATLLWLGSSVYLRDYNANYSTPNIAKITQGEYMKLGPKRNAKDGSRQNEIFIHNIQKITKVLAINLKPKDIGRKRRILVPSEQKLSIPLTYPGWFEALSEDGRIIKPVQAVRDLVRINAHTCLVRENIKAHKAKDNGEISLESSRIVQAGERIVLNSSGVVTVNTSKGPNQYIRFLDEDGNNIFFSLDQRGLFSPIAGPSNISGVHSIKGILSKFRLPITIQLVHGATPLRHSDKSKFSGIIRLLYVFDDEIAFTCSLTGQERMLPIPTQVPLRVVPSANYDEIKTSSEMQFVSSRCAQMARSYLSNIHLLYNISVCPPPKPMKNAPGIMATQENPDIPPTKVTNLPKAEEEQLFDEVEDIYLYVVRYGISPPETPSKVIRSDRWSDSDKDCWEEPIYQTYRGKKPSDQTRSKDIAFTTDDETRKVFRFHTESDEQDTSKPKATVVLYTKEEFEDGLKDGNGADTEEPPPLPPRLYERSHSLADIETPDNVIRESKPIRDFKRRQSQPVNFFRNIFNSKGKDKADKDVKQGDHSSGSRHSGASTEDSIDEERRKAAQKTAKQKYKSLYL